MSDKEKKLHKLLTIEQIPDYLKKKEPYILTGYRNHLTTKLCIKRYC